MTLNDKDDGRFLPTYDDSHNEQYDVRHPTRHPLRDRARELLCNKLLKDDETFVETRKEAEVIANSIENAMYDKYYDPENKREYLNTYHRLAFNIKDPKNANLRMALLHRHLAPLVLVTMTSDQLANNELKEKRKKMLEKQTRKVDLSTGQKEGTTEMFKCGKCKERKCTYYQMQTRSADEPMTTFVTCRNCNNRWKF